MSEFTPQYVTYIHRRRLIASVLLLTLVAGSMHVLSAPRAGQATTNTTWVGSELTSGTNLNTMSTDDVTLSLQTVVDETREDFTLEDFQTDILNRVVSLDDGGLTLNEGHLYSVDSSPPLADNTVYDSFIHQNLLYASTRIGLSVIDTQGTPDPSDDVLVALYNTASTPALANNTVNYTFIHQNLLYVGTNDGLSVIDTQGTLDQSDDVLVTRYHTGSTPALFRNVVLHAFIDGNLLYISTSGGGLSVIHTQGTLDPSDDVLVTRYHTGSNPALAGNTTNHAFLNNNLLYVATVGGLSVINTLGTLDPGDDVLSALYSNGSTPQLAGFQVNHAFLDNNLLYISTTQSFFTSGLSVIDTQGTPDQSDDVLVAIYSADSSPALVNDSARHAFLDNDVLYISTFADGLHVIDTQGTPDQSDDVLVTRYHTDSTLALLDNRVDHSFIHNNFLYVANAGPAGGGVADGGLSVFTPGNYFTSGVYRSTPRRIDSTPTTTISAAAIVDADQSVDLSYRTGSADAVWREEFATADSYNGGAFYGYGDNFDWQTVEAVDGVLRLSGQPTGSPNYAMLVVESGYLADHFTAGSQVSMRYRVLNRPEDSTEIGLWVDEYDDGEYFLVPDSEWNIASFSSQSNFSNFLIEIDTNSSGINFENTIFEIDYVQVVTPDSMGEWGSWNVCIDLTCTLPDLSGASYLQYKLDLDTTNSNTTPTVTSVTYSGEYPSSGTYTSSVQSFDTAQNFISFEADIMTPAGTSISFEYSTNNGQSWFAITPGQVFPAGTEADTIQWRANLTTTNPALSPTIRSVFISSTPLQASARMVGTSMTARVANLEAQGKQDEAAALRAQHPHLFTNTSSTPSDSDNPQQEFIQILTDTVDMLERFLELQRQENSNR